MRPASKLLPKTQKAVPLIMMRRRTASARHKINKGGSNQVKKPLNLRSFLTSCFKQPVRPAFIMTLSKTTRSIYLAEVFA